MRPHLGSVGRAPACAAPWLVPRPHEPAQRDKPLIPALEVEAGGRIGSSRPSLAIQQVRCATQSLKSHLKREKVKTKQDKTPTNKLKNHTPYALLGSSAPSDRTVTVCAQDLIPSPELLSQDGPHSLGHFLSCCLNQTQKTNKEDRFKIQARPWSALVLSHRTGSGLSLCAPLQALHEQDSQTHRQDRELTK